MRRHVIAKILKAVATIVTATTLIFLILGNRYEPGTTALIGTATG